MTAYLHIGTTNTGNQEKTRLLDAKRRKAFKKKAIFIQKALEWQIGIGLW